MNNKQLRDFYYSERSFQFFKTEDSPFFHEELVCECLIDGEWYIFTEQTPHGSSALSYRWGDLIFLGSGTECRYTPARDYLRKQKEHA